VEKYRYFVEKIRKTISIKGENRWITVKILWMNKLEKGDNNGAKMWISANFLWISPINCGKTVLEIC